MKPVPGGLRPATVLHMLLSVLLLVWLVLSAFS